MSFVTKANVRFTELFEVCIQQNLPFVSYLLPNSDELNILIQYKSFPRKISLTEISSFKGFVVAPFDVNNHLSTYLFEPDMHIKNICTSDQLKLLKDIQRFREIKTPQKSINSTPENEFIHHVSESVKKIKEGQFEKVVLSRVLVEQVNEGFNPAMFFDRVYSAYPNTLRYIFNIPGAGCWMGATPEPLLNIKGPTIEITSLAGTQKLNNQPVDDVSWNSKELLEQNYVTNYIEKAIHKFQETNYSKEGPFNFRAANVIHLKSVFKIQSHHIVSQLGNFIGELHPTPSVCGLPKSKALKYIKELENHSREYYTGFLGPINFMDETQLFVNLRCMQWTGNNFVLYAGAGITAGSEPELEWEETNQKLVAMLSSVHQTE